MTHFGIIHYTKRVRDTLTDCIASLHAAGVSYMAIYPDAGEFGALRNMHRALVDLALHAAPEDHVCVVDDDLVVCLYALDLTYKRIKDGNVPALTMYTVEQNIPHDLREANGWVEAPVSVNTWGGVVVMERMVALMVADRMLKMLDDPQLQKAPDAAMFKALGELGIPVLHHLPSLVQDIGDGASTIGNEHTPETKGFRYHEWN